MLVFVGWASASWSDSRYPTKYDRVIRSAAEEWLPGIPWRLWKAQLYQESLLNPAARSHVGAEGIAQFMPRTWEEVAKALGYQSISPKDADYAIQAGAYYMSRQRLAWRKLHDLNRHKYAAASYNAGLGNIRKAHQLCQETADWEVTKECLDGVTGRHSQETLTYVQRIWRWWKEMEAGL